MIQEETIKEMPREREREREREKEREILALKNFVQFERIYDNLEGTSVYNRESLTSGKLLRNFCSWIIYSTLSY